MSEWERNVLRAFGCKGQKVAPKKERLAIGDWAGQYGRIGIAGQADGG